MKIFHNLLTRSKDCSICTVKTDSITTTQTIKSIEKTTIVTTKIVTCKILKHQVQPYSSEKSKVIFF